MLPFIHTQTVPGAGDLPAENGKYKVLYRVPCRDPGFKEAFMSVNLTTVKRVAHLARIALNEEEAQCMSGELNAILGFVEQLDEVDVAGVEPMTSVLPMAMRMREDVVTDGNRAQGVVANAPVTGEGFFLVPKVVE